MGILSGLLRLGIGLAAGAVGGPVAGAVAGGLAAPSGSGIGGRILGAGTNFGMNKLGDLLQGDNFLQEVGPEDPFERTLQNQAGSFIPPEIQQMATQDPLTALSLDQIRNMTEGGSFIKSGGYFNKGGIF